MGRGNYGVIWGYKREDFEFLEVYRLSGAAARTGFLRIYRCINKYIAIEKGYMHTGTMRKNI